MGLLNRGELLSEWKVHWRRKYLKAKSSYEMVPMDWVSCEEGTRCWAPEENNPNFFTARSLIFPPVRRELNSKDWIT